MTRGYCCDWFLLATGERVIYQRWNWLSTSAAFVTFHYWLLLCKVCSVSAPLYIKS